MSLHEKNLKATQYNGIDITKFLMSICVVAIHTNPIEKVTSTIIKNTYSAIVGQAVPFFFIASSFFLFSKFDTELYSEKNYAKLKKYLLRFCELYICWHIIYLPLTVHGFSMYGYTLKMSIDVFIRNILFVGEQWFSWPLWYLLSTIYAAFFLMILIKFKVKEKNIYKAAGIIYITSLFFTEFVKNNDAYGNIFQAIISQAIKIFPNGRIFGGIGIITFSMFCMRNRKVSSLLPENRKKLIIVWIILSTILVIMKSTNIIIIPDIVNIFCSYVLFLYAKSFCGRVTTKKYSFYRKASTVLYFTHMLWYFVVGKLIDSVDIAIVNGAEPFLLTLALSLITAIIVEKLAENKLLKKIF